MKGWWQCPLGVCLVAKVEIRDLGSGPDLGHCLVQPSPPPPQSPPSMPLKATFLRVSGPLSPSQGSSQEFAALP